MNNHTRLVNAMRKTLGINGIQETPASGEFILSALKTILFPGAVYGFAVSLSENEWRALFAEVQARGMSNLAKLESFKPIEGSLYPIYWGKDKYLGARPHQHLRNPDGTGSIRLSTYSTLYGKPLVCASLVVTDNVSAEVALKSAFPDLLKTSRDVYIT